MKIDFPSSLLLPRLFSLLIDLLFFLTHPLKAKNTLLFIGFWLRYSSFKKKNTGVYARCFLYHHFSFVIPNLSYKIFLETSCCRLLYAYFLSKFGYQIKKLIQRICNNLFVRRKTDLTVCSVQLLGKLYCVALLKMLIRVVL